jgi:hypothetical protein
MMMIHIEPHTLQRANERGASKREILEVIETGENIQGKSGRLGRSKIYKFNNVSAWKVL